MRSSSLLEVMCFGGFGYSFDGLLAVCRSSPGVSVCACALLKDLITAIFLLLLPNTKESDEHRYIYLIFESPVTSVLLARRQQMRLALDSSFYRAVTLFYHFHYPSKDVCTTHQIKGRSKVFSVVCAFRRTAEKLAKC